MSWSYTPGASPKDNVRLLITDTDTNNQIFEDEEITAQLNMESELQPGIQTGTIDTITTYFAAATLLETIGSSETLRQKVVRMMDVQTDGAKELAALMKRAATLREQASQDTGEFDWAEMIEEPFSERDRIYDQALRNAI